MIKEYINGQEFIKENSDFLDINKYMSTFFYMDAKLLNDVNKDNYVFRVVENQNKLLALKVEPYDLMLYGNKECTYTLFKYLKDNNYSFNKVLCSIDIGDELIKNHNFKIKIGMDFMEATTISEKSCNGVGIPSLDDVDELVKYMNDFLNECGIDNKVIKDDIIKIIKKFRVIKIDNDIVSFAKMSEAIDGAVRISYVYTNPKYRGLGYARKVVNNIKNEIIENGYLATLNVDRANPISNHIYSSLGFKKVFSQGEYELINR